MEIYETTASMPQKVTQDTRKRKRPCVPPEQRQRAPVACASCRRLKEKCDGSIPCQRCQRYKRECFAVPDSGSIETDLLRDRAPSLERVQDLEFVVRHCLGNGPLSDVQLRRLVLSLETKSNSQSRAQDVDELTLDQELFTVKTLSHSVAHYSGELSHWNFSQRVREQADKRLKNVTPASTQEQPILEYWRANHLHSSRSSAIRKLMTSLPPKHVALFLANTYFKYAQTNTFFVEEAWSLMKINDLYSTGETLCGGDAAWLCTTLGVLAVGTAFVHMEESRSQPPLLENEGGDSAAAVAGESFYKLAAELIPDVITIASVQSVQAFLLLAHYALPLDTAGLAYTYLGLAVKMAIQNGMHRHYSGDLDSDTVDLRNRLWWSAYRLEKRVSILHGRPTSISSNEIDAEYPSDKSPGSTHQSRVLENAMTKITDWLGDIAVIIHMLRRSPKRLRRAYFERMLQVRQQYLDWFQDANIPAPTASSRAVAHIHMSYHLNLVFLGRPFMFQSQPSSISGESVGNAHDGASSPRQKMADLIQDAVNSAEQIVNTAMHLQAGPGLARASYIEFSSCRAAILVLLAQCLNEPCRKLRAKLTDGMKLIKHMAPANASTESEASVMTAIEAAIQQLDSREELLVSNTLTRPRDNFTSFMKWASGFQNGEGDNVPAWVADDENSMASARTSEIKENFGWSPLDVSILDGEPESSAGFDSYHFEDAFSIAHGGELCGDSTIWQ